MKINKHKIIWMVLAAAIVVVLLIMWLIGVSPRRQQIAEANAQTAQIEQQNKKLSDEIRDLSVASINIQLQKNRLAQIQRQIPATYNQSEFIASLNQAAADSGVTISSVSFSSAVDAQLPTAASNNISTGRLVQVPVTIAATGNYDALRNFVNGIQHIERIDLATNVSYSIGDDPNQSTVSINSYIWALLSSEVSHSANASVSSDSSASSASSSSGH